MNSVSKPPLIRLHYRDPDGWEGVLVVDSLVNGVAMGGCRFTRTVDANEVGRLARGMTRKNQVLNVAMGGAKCGIRYNPRDSKKQEVLAKFYSAIKPYVLGTYATGPDMNTAGEELDSIMEQIGVQWRLQAAVPNQADVAAVRAEYEQALALQTGRFTFGYARTGYGAAACALTAAKHKGMDDQLSLAVHGFGMVGSAAAGAFVDAGHKVVGVADAGGGYYCEAGFDVDALIAGRGSDSLLTRESMPSNTVSYPPEQAIAAKCDVLMLAATKDAIHAGNVADVDCKIVCEPANIALTTDAVYALHAREIPVIPDYIASGGGVVSAVKLIRREFSHTDGALIRNQLESHLTEVTLKALEVSESKRLPIPLAMSPDAGLYDSNV